MGVTVDLGEYGTVDLGFDLAEKTRQSMNQFVGQQSVNALRKTGTDIAKGAAVGPFTAAPDIVGLGMQGVNKLANYGQRKFGLPELNIAPNSFSGDPIRKTIGLDPRSTAGIAGEFLDPTNALAKAPAMAAKVAGALPDMIRASDIPNALAMTLFHGTPHKFEKFDIGKIGTGEGAQAFGHGLYFAESPGVARSYQSDLTDFRIELDGNQLDARDFITDQTQPEALRSIVLDAFNDPQRGGIAGVRESAKGQIEHFKNIDGADDIVRENQEILDTLDEFGDRIKDSQGHLYEVEIPDNITDKMLDWDKPLSEQPEFIQELADKIPNTHGPSKPLMTGGDVVKNLEVHLKSKEAASKALNEAGIPGIRYKSGQLSGGAGDTSNIVVFNPDDIKQVKRDGEEVFNALRK